MKIFHTLLSISVAEVLFSLRHPSAIGSAYYQPNDRDSESDDLQYGSTYFDYKKYNFLYRFFDSYEFHRLEKRFHNLQTFDISKCFNHIYTHTISWAVRSKSFAKAQLRRRTFDAVFDEVMQSANHRETAGILIGPEVSRIFAEIILQKVDFLVAERLKEENLRQGIDFDIRRYVDDYFIFSISSAIGKKVAQYYHHELSIYRLYFNQAKSVEFVVPFMTAISCAKVELSTVLDEFFASVITKNQHVDGTSHSELRIFWNPRAKASRLIQRIKVIVTKHRVEYSSITGFFFAVFERRLRSILKLLSKVMDNEQAIGSFFYTLLDVAFFFYAMDIRVSTTYKITRLSLYIVKFLDKLPPQEIVEQVKKKIYDESMRILTTEIKRQPELYVETLNLLIALRILGPEFYVVHETLEVMIEVLKRKTTGSQSEMQVDYFLITALLFYIGDNQQYAAQKAHIEQKLVDIFRSAEDPFKRTDLTCLFLDILNCPFLNTAFKQQLVDNVRIDGGLLSASEKNDILYELPKHQWFTDWNARDSVDVLLERKRYRTPY